jgi:hypothetical protein
LPAFQKYDVKNSQDGFWRHFEAEAGIQGGVKAGGF